MKLNEKLKSIRTKYNFSRDFIAKKLGYKTQSTIQKWESGTAEPPIGKLYELAALYKIPITDLLEDNVPSNVNTSSYRLLNTNQSVFLSDIFLNHYAPTDDNEIVLFKSNKHQIFAVEIIKDVNKIQSGSLILIDDINKKVYRYFKDDNGTHILHPFDDNPYEIDRTFDNDISLENVLVGKVILYTTSVS